MSKISEHLGYSVGKLKKKVSSRHNHVENGKKVAGCPACADRDAGGATESERVQGKN